MLCGGGGGCVGDGASSSDAKVRELAARIMEKLPKPFDLKHAHPDTFKVMNELMMFQEYCITDLFLVCRSVV